ncbi:uncharacterized protein KY384_001354 [Bacidia gigantensis]|uniref:uncharacterized protein n=1 Tax=Bacidia gigantensis TaxID=2732470 RepID=UPI001D03722A|nr:uncharacterized protein KY384_001354 [Bacidia gigantensis]KAG8533614.1 hypothetical protein KY384_001354 [Bacidia gigantensis]
MPQGALKKAKPASTGTKRSTSSGVKKGQRTIAPKKKALANQHKLTKKFNAAMVGKTERSLAEKAGHLEMIGGKKKSAKEGKTHKNV